MYSCVACSNLTGKLGAAIINFIAMQSLEYWLLVYELPTNQTVALNFLAILGSVLSYFPNMR